MVGSRKSPSPLSKFAKTIKSRTNEFFELVFQHIKPNIAQKDIEKLYKKLRKPVANVPADIARYGKKFPLLNKLGADKVGWILLQAADTFHLAVSLFNHKDVSPASKAKLACAIVYFISPIDALPEGLLGPIGFVDDVLVVVWVLDSILNGQSEREKELVRELWLGSAEDLDRLRAALKHFDVIKALVAFARRKKT